MPIFLHKSVHGLVPLDQAPSGGLLQQRKAVGIQGTVVHPVGLRAPGLGGDLLPGQQPLLRQQFQVDEVGVARIGGKALVGGVSVARGAQGQHLPPGLSGVPEKIDKIISSLAQGTDAVGGGQGKNWQDHAAGSFHCVTSYGRCLIRRRGAERLL